MRSRAGWADATFGMCACLLVLWATAPLAQDSARPAFRVSTELVVVDLIASDRSRGFVGGLQASDIQVLEDGKPQRVEFVRLVRHGAGRATGRAVAPPTPPTVGAPAPSLASQSEAAGEPIRIIVAIDLVSTPADEFVRVKDAIVAMLRDELPPGPEVMLVTLWHGLTVEENFTADRERLIATVNGLRTPLADRISFLQMLDTAQQACETGATPDVVLAQLIGLGRNYITETRQDLTRTSAALGALSRASAALSGRKHIVLYSRGYALNAVAHVIDLVANAAATGCGGDPTRYRQTAAQELSAAGTTLTVTSLIDPNVIAFSRSADVNHASIGVHGVLRDEKGKWVGGKELFGREITPVLNLRAASFTMNLVPRK